MSTPTKKLMRGEIYYIHSFPTCGHEQRSGRPAVIVSNNENNSHSEVVEICFLTLKDKNPLPTHIFIDRGPCINSTVLCEQITSVSTDRIGDFMCRLPEHLEEELNHALQVSLSLRTNKSDSNGSNPERTPDSSMDKIKDLKHHIESLYQDLTITKDDNAVIRSALKSANQKAEMYERMYNDLLDRLVNRGVK